jgi:hypothetical protein
MPGLIEGTLSGCPFCRSVSSPTFPPVGTRIRKLSGIDIGRSGTVTQSPYTAAPTSNEFLAHMDGDPEATAMRIRLKEFERLPASDPPNWAPPISLSDASGLDELVIHLCEKGNSPDGWAINWNAYYEVICLIWRRRIPITADEWWSVLHAHGIDDRFAPELKDFFTRGRDLLVTANGKKPANKKRTVPFYSSW